MGIRIHKMCGYGLTDLVEDDPRISQESPFITHSLYKEEHLDEYISFYKENEKETPCLDDVFLKEMKKKGEKLPRIQDTLQIGGGEDGMDNVLCLRPVTMTDWYRFDDMLDWIEETYIFERNEDLEDSVTILPHGIFPYSASYMDARTGERLKDCMEWVRVWTNADYEQQEALRSSGTMDIFAALFDMTHEEAEQFVVPAVPADIIQLANYGKLFTSDDVWKQLRPMIYSWWA